MMLPLREGTKNFRRGSLGMKLNPQHLNILDHKCGSEHVSYDVNGGGKTRFRFVFCSLLAIDIYRIFENDGFPALS